ncbi:MAG TPA: NAD(P)-dependent oxidoreductase [Pseudolabrys sp.]|nr:NAD(P)-dependent oxidoreductase [Pseudolabrys sp.]
MTTRLASGKVARESRQEGIQHMDIGFIGLGNMGQPMARRLIAAGHKLIVYDTRNDAVAPLVAMGAQVASSPADVADRVETVMASLPSLQISEKVALGEGGVIEGKRIKRFIDLSTTGATVAARIAAGLARKNIVQIDCPVSGGVGGASKGTLAVMVSGPKAEIDLVKDVLAVFGKVFVIGEQAGMAQTMKLANNFLSATAMAATSEAVAMGVKAGLDPTVMIDVINAGSGRTTASDGKFPQAILPRTFNYGFATALMLKDVRLCVEQAKSLNVPNSVMSAVLDQWETTNKEFGGDSDFTAIVKMVEQRAGVIVGKKT